MSIWGSLISGFLGGAVGQAMNSPPAGDPTVAPTVEARTSQVAQPAIVAWAPPPWVEHIIVPHPVPHVPPYIPPNDIV